MESNVFMNIWLTTCYGKVGGRSNTVEGLYFKRPIQCQESSELLTPHPLAARRVYTPLPLVGGGGGGHTRWVERGWGGEDARHSSVLYICKYFVSNTFPHLTIRFSMLVHTHIFTNIYEDLTPDSFLSFIPSCMLLSRMVQIIPKRAPEWGWGGGVAGWEQYASFFILKSAQKGIPRFLLCEVPRTTNRWLCLIFVGWGYAVPGFKIQEC